MGGFIGGAFGGGNSEVASRKWPSKSSGNSFIAGLVNWCKVADLSASVCADQLVKSLNHHFGNSWGCMVTKPGYASWNAFYNHWDDDDEYYVYCHPYSSTSVNKSDLIYMCRNAAHACVGESNVPACMRDLLKKTPTFCPDKYTLLVAPSNQDTALDHMTSGYIARRSRLLGGD